MNVACITPSAAAVVSSACPLGDVSDEPLLNKWGFHTVPGLRSYPVGQALNAESGRPIVICPVLLLSGPIALLMMYPMSPAHIRRCTSADDVPQQMMVHIMHVLVSTEG